MALGTLDKIPAETAGTLAGLFRERVRRTPDAIAYRHYDEVTGRWQDSSWADMAAAVAHWQAAFAGEGLRPGDRVAILLRNCREWVIFDQAALGSGLVVVPLYLDDRPENTAYILNNAGVKLLYLRGAEQWERLLTVHDQLAVLVRIVTQEPVEIPDGERRVRTLADWLPAGRGELLANDGEPDQLATIVYTSGTTGRPKGVMLSHRNILANADSGLEYVPMYREDVLLSFLPLSHTFERTMATSSFDDGRRHGGLCAFHPAACRRPAGHPPDRAGLGAAHLRAHLQRDPRQAGSRGRRCGTKLFTLAVDVGWHRFECQQGRAAWHPKLLLWPMLKQLVADKMMARLGGRLRISISGGAALSAQGVAAVHRARACRWSRATA